MFAKAITLKEHGLMGGGKKHGMDGSRRMLGNELGLESKGQTLNGLGSLIRTLDLSLGHKATAKILKQRCA